MSESRTLSAATAASPLASIERELNRLQREIRLTIQDQLATLAGCSLGDLKQHQQLTAAISQLLDSHGLRVRCPQCGHPAILRVSARGGIPSGAFVFDHTIEGRRTFHGGQASLPKIRLMNKPPRKRPGAAAPRAAG